jgi:hypothetical protein
VSRNGTIRLVDTASGSADTLAEPASEGAEAAQASAPDEAGAPAGPPVPRRRRRRGGRRRRGRGGGQAVVASP